MELNCYSDLSPVTALTLCSDAEGRRFLSVCLSPPTPSLVDSGPVKNASALVTSCTCGEARERARVITRFAQLLPPKIHSFPNYRDNKSDATFVSTRNTSTSMLTLSPPVCSRSCFGFFILFRLTCLE